MKITDKIKLLLKLNKLWKLIKGAKTMNDWKTTLTGTVTLLAWAAAKFGFDVPTDIQLQIIAIGGWVVTLLARDSHK